MLVLFLVSLLLLPTAAGSTVIEDVSDPGNVNRLFSDFKTPVIRPGNDDTLSFTLTNPYEADMERVTLAVEIYAYATLDDIEKDLSRLDDLPVFRTSQDTVYSVDLGTLPSGYDHFNDLTLETRNRTPEGVYFLRFTLEFEYGDEEVLMKSRGHFSDQEWQEAERRPGESDRPYYVGNLNITALGINGLISDSSFSVKTPIPRWPQYMLGGFAAFFGILAVMIYMQEEYNSFPWLEKTLNEWSGKFKQFRRRLEHRLRQR